MDYKKVITPDALRWVAHGRADKLITVEVGPDPIATLRSIKWANRPQSVYDQAEVARANLNLDPRYCLGRSAVCAAVIEKYFPTTTVAALEVMQDMLRNLMVQDLPSHSMDESYVQELLSYEEPHFALLLGVYQYDPLESFFEQSVRIEHKQVRVLPIWKAIAAAVLVSYASFEISPSARLEVLLHAERVCPELLLIQENKVEPLIALGQTSEALRILEHVLQERPHARCMFVLWGLTQELRYYNMLVRKYGLTAFQLIAKEIS